MQKNNLLKLYKLNKACFVSMVICTVMLGIAGILCEEIFDASKEETNVIFITKSITVVFIVVSVVGLFITIYFFVKLSKKYNKILNEIIGPNYKVLQKADFLSIVDNSLLFMKRMDFEYLFALVGQEEDIPFEYYHIKAGKNFFHFEVQSKYIDVFVFKNIEVFQQDMIVSTKDKAYLKNDFMKSTMKDYFIYSKKEVNWEGGTLPKNAFFFSVINHTGYLFVAVDKKEFSKPNNFKAESEFKMAVDTCVEEMKQYYEICQTWLK